MTPGHAPRNANKSAPPASTTLRKLGRLDGAAHSFQLQLDDAVIGDIHLLEPGSHCFLLRRLPNTVDFAFGQVGITLQSFDVRILLRSLRYLRILLTSDALDRVCAHEFCHDVFLSGFVVCCFSPSRWTKSPAALPVSAAT